MTNAVQLPSPEEIAVPQELTLPAVVLKAGTYQLGKYCDWHMKVSFTDPFSLERDNFLFFLFQEFALCRSENADPRKCLKEGAELTACGVDFFRKVKQLCRQEFEDYLYCVDVGAKDPNGQLRW